MSKSLVIVESPGKISKISQYLGSDYIVKASYGHVQDLDKKTLSIEVENNFKPLYVTNPDKLKVVKELKNITKSCKEVILAADGDREGEAIAYSLASVLKLDNPKRIIFHEITKQAITKAIESPTEINNNMVNAQQARRLLDRLVGYLISPVLWKYLPNNNFGDNKAQSAGRVQSVVVRIIIDKENEINKSISNPYWKTTSEFIFNDTKLNGILSNESNELYQFDNEDSAKEFLLNIYKKTTFKVTTKKTVFKVVDIDNKISIRKPSQPFITSSLQQEASTKLHFSVKKTMDVAQKLYEAGLITYMRTDSPNISKDAISAIKKYVVNTYGEEYSEPKNYQSKNANSQDAHECIRPTHFDKPECDINEDMRKLYSLIWNRTIASQMSNAKVNIQTIKIDALNNKKSILIFDKQNYFVSMLENIIFDGFLKVYDNTKDSEEEKCIGKLDIKVKDIVELKNIKVFEEYTKLPLRYNESLLVKYLEKNGIGRPSTYASIISKVIDRKYVEIKNIDGIKKDSKQLLLDNKYNIKEITKEITIGKEQKKLVPTEMGNIVNDFMMKNFEPIMDIEFTANFETHLDKIADGKANWVTVLRTFYDMFNPMVDKLLSEAKTTEKSGIAASDKLLGTNSEGLEIYTGSGKYGPYVKIKDGSKWRYAPIKETTNPITLESAIKLLEFPLDIGKIGTKIVTLNKGPYGLYLKCGKVNYAIKDKDVNISDIDISFAKNLIDNGQKISNSESKSDEIFFKLKDKTIYVKTNGPHGPYIQIVSGNKKQNISIPSKYNPSSIKLDEIMQIIASKNGTKKY